MNLLDIQIEYRGFNIWYPKLEIETTGIVRIPAYTANLEH
jgi:hypothetical protein